MAPLIYQRVAQQAGKTAALALILMGARLTLPARTATRLREQADLIATVLLPRLELKDSAARIGRVVAEQAIAARKAMVDAGLARDAAPVFYDAAAYLRTGLDPTHSPALRRAGFLARALLACGEAAFLGQAFVAEAQSNFADRQSAVAARDRIALAMEEASDRIAAGAGREIYGILATTARQATEFLVAEASELRPVVRVEALRSWPSTALAWSLYGDPARALELCERNRIGTPLFLPPVVEALSPDVQ